MPNANGNEVLPSLPARTRVARAALFAVALGGFSFLLASSRVPCGFALVFHTPCPGCGSTRAMLALASGDLHAFARYNPLAPFMTFLVVVVMLQGLASLVATGTFRRVGKGTLGVVVARSALVVASLQVVLWLARFGGLLGGPVPV